MYGAITILSGLGVGIGLLIVLISWDNSPFTEEWFRNALLGVLLFVGGGILAVWSYGCLDLEIKNQARREANCTSLGGQYDSVSHYCWVNGQLVDLDEER